MLLSSPSIFEYRTTRCLSRKAVVTLLDASDYLRRRFARRRSYTARMPPVSRAVYNLRKGATMNNLYRVGRV